jgi:hypothetical protein
MHPIIHYRRIMEKNGAYSWNLHIISAVICGWSLALLFESIFACNPIAMPWHSSITEGTCIEALGIATAVTNISLT